MPTLCVTIVKQELVDFVLLDFKFQVHTEFQFSFTEKY